MIGTRPPRLIDWEYAAVGDPLIDLACLLAYYPQVLPHGADCCCKAAASPGSATIATLEDAGPRLPPGSESVVSPAGACPPPPAPGTLGSLA